MARKSALAVFGWMLYMLASNASAQDAPARWEFVTISASGDLVTYDNRTVVRRGDYVTAWVAYDSMGSSKNSDAKVKQILQREQYNCTAMTSSLLSRIAYDENGDVLASIENATSPRPVPPDSIAEAVWLALCK